MKKTAIPELIFGPTPDDFGGRLDALLNEWEDKGMPTLAVLAGLSFAHFPPEERLSKAVMKAARLGDASHRPNAFHNHAHFVKVFVNTLRLMTTHEELCNKDLTPRQRAFCMIAAAIHDIGHQGRVGNIDPQTKAHVPYLEESNSFSLARGPLTRAGLSADELADVEVIIRTTDVSGQPSPASWMDRLYTGKPDKALLPPELARLHDNPGLVLCCKILRVADIATSFITYERAQKENRFLMQEMGQKAGTAKSQLFFMEQICPPVFDLPAAKKLYLKPYQEILEKVRIDAAHGRIYEDPASAGAAIATAPAVH